MSHSRSDEFTNRNYLIQEVVCNFRDAIVTVISSVNDDAGCLIDKYFGNGFFIKGHYIICPASLILVPTCNNSIERVERILITVSNVNGSGISYCYEADIVGVDGASNIGILYFDMSRKWNLTCPPIRQCHPFLNWGKSRNSCPGDTIIIIGETSGKDRLGLSKKLIGGVSENGVAIGNISDNRYVSYGGSIPGELLLLSNIIPDGNQSGMPIINTLGCVIGMYLHSEYTKGMNVALSEYFMRRPTRALIKSFVQNSIPDNYNGFIEIINNHKHREFFRYTKSTLGLGCYLMSASDYHTSTSCKDIVGYKITTISNDDLTNKLEIGDIITHVNDCPLGDRKAQISPALVMWRIPPNHEVKIKYRKRSNNYEGMSEMILTTQSYDYYMDYPWYSIELTEEFEKILPIII